MTDIVSLSPLRVSQLFAILKTWILWHITLIPPHLITWISLFHFIKVVKISNTFITYNNNRLVRNTLSYNIIIRITQCGLLFDVILHNTFLWMSLSFFIHKIVLFYEIWNNKSNDLYMYIFLTPLNPITCDENAQNMFCNYFYELEIMILKQKIFPTLICFVFH